MTKHQRSTSKNEVAQGGAEVEQDRQCDTAPPPPPYRGVGGGGGALPERSGGGGAKQPEGTASKKLPEAADGIPIHPKQPTEQVNGKETFLVVEQEEVSRDRLLAALAVTPSLRHSSLLKVYAGRYVNGEDNELTASQCAAVLSDLFEKLEDGSTAMLIRILAAQAITLDAVATDLLSRAATHQYVDGMETYTRLALKTQANSRATIEALGKIMRGGEQIVKHIHVDNRGGQTVVAETINQQRGAGIIANDEGQPYGAAEPSELTSLPGPDETRNEMPIPRDAKRPVPHPRRKKPRRSEG